MKTTPALNVYVLKEVFKHLDLVQRSRCARVCKTWYEAESYLKINRLRLYLGMPRSDDETTEFLLVKSDEQLKRVFREPKLENLKALNVYSFRNSTLCIPVIDLKNFKNLVSLQLSGFYYENNIFMVLLQRNIKLEKLEYLSAPYVHISIVSLVMPNLKRIRSVNLLMPAFDKKLLTWIEFEHRGITAIPSNVLNYLMVSAPQLRAITLTVSSVAFLPSLKTFANLEKLNLNVLPDHLSSCLEEFHSLLSTIIEKELTIRINGLPVQDLDLRVFIDRPFKTNYCKLSKYFHLSYEDLSGFFNNFTELEILEHTSAKIKSLKRFNLKLNSVNFLKYKVDENSKYLFSKFFVRIPNLESLELFQVENLEQSQFDQLPALWPNLISINLRSTSLLKVDARFLESFKCLCAISLENLNFLNDSGLQYAVNKLKHLNQLTTTNCLFSLKKTYESFLKKTRKNSVVQFNLNLNHKYHFTSMAKWKQKFKN